MNYKNMPTAELGIMNFPIDLILEIFFKLPVKDLLCCMGTCKSWYRLIRNPNFTAEYRRNSPFSIILVFHWFTTLSFSLVEIAPSGEFCKRDIQPKLPNHSEKGSSLLFIDLLDGLLFVLLRKNHDSLVKDQFYFCNPLFGGCFKLGDQRIVDQRNYRTKYELGFDPLVNKFKLLSFVYRGAWRFQEAQILTIGEDDKWRRLEEPLSPFELVALGTYYNGDYYCFTKDGNDVYLSTFDFQKEKWSRLAKYPDFLPESSGGQPRVVMSYRQLRVIGNHLCMIKYPGNSDEIAIWTMEEGGVSWSLSKKIFMESCIPRRMNIRFLLPLNVSRNGDMLFIHWIKGKLVYFNLVDQKLIEVREDLQYALMYAPRFCSIQTDIALGQNGVLQMFG